MREDIAGARAKRKRAMLSVFEACSLAEDARISSRLKAMPLPDALKILCDAPDKGGQWARQRALAKLVSSDLHKRAALKASIERLAATIDQHARPPPGVDEDSQALPAATKAVIEGSEEKVLGAVTHVANVRRIPTTKVEYDPRTLISKVIGKVAVTKTVEDCRKLIDPLHWGDDEYDSPFNAVYRVRMHGASPEYDEKRRPQEDKRDPKLGKPWVLFEDVQFSMNDATMSRFQNLLNIVLEEEKEGSQLRGIKANYWLFRCMSSRISLFTRPGGLDVDSGYFRARAIDESETEIKVVKNLRFTDATPRDAAAFDYGQMMNYLAPSMLGTWIDATLSAINEL